jgi:hypothetical protein
MHPGTPFDIYPLTLKGTDERTDTIMGVRDTGIRPGINWSVLCPFLSYTETRVMEGPQAQLLSRRV